MNTERLILLQCILENRGVNIGILIQKEILAFAFKPKGCLFFPSLIIELCLRLRLEISSANEMLPNTRAINTTTIKRFSLPSGKSALSKVPQTRETGDLVARV